MNRTKYINIVYG